MQSEAGHILHLCLAARCENRLLTEHFAQIDTVLAYKKRNQLGRFAPSASPAPHAAPPIPSDLVPGARCQVSLSDELKRRGTVRFVGPTEFGPQDGSVWVGVEWDEPVGKNDGT